MSQLFFLLLLALPGALQAQANPAYTVTIHVTASRITVFCGAVGLGGSSCNSEQQITADVGSSTYEMSNFKSIKGIVALGDYKGKLVEDKTWPTNEFNKTYELLVPDGSARKFNVTGQLK